MNPKGLESCCSRIFYNIMDSRTGRLVNTVPIVTQRDVCNFMDLNFPDEEWELFDVLETTVSTCDRTTVKVLHVKQLGIIVPELY